MFLYFEQSTILKGAYVSLQDYDTLFKDGRPLNNVLTWEAGIDAFFRWLQEKFPNGVILAAHGGRYGDAKLIVRDFKVAGIRDGLIKDTVVGFVDTFEAFKYTFPGKLLRHLDYL